ncbi:hypothetical protein DRF60_12200 [Chryseobacterium elymi]|uniref:Sugar-binding protein n=1 Tax=Chryseobacterium elymi TaxID=395936 RepID=A0A3D9DGN8_9FLAO|nr:hypothetical protein [Chryseobacterium elymi]REC77167.1 hypothetical protein DRF60_12200 [Chryseobacterium elymi]
MRYVIIFFFIFCKSFSQLSSCKEFELTELRVKRPQVEFPDHQVEFGFLKKLPIKTMERGNSIQEYDRNGNLISTKNIAKDYYQSTNVCQYKNGILTESRSISIADKTRIESYNEESMRRGNEEMKQNGTGTAAIMDPQSTESVYTAVLNNKNQVVSYKKEKIEINGSNRKIIGSDTGEFIYKDGNISEAKYRGITEQYFYKNGLLSEVKRTEKKQWLFERRNTNQYIYDSRKNLIAISYSTEDYQDGKYQSGNKGQKDSATYDNKNRLIRIGSKKNFIPYKYDAGNNITEISEYSNNKLQSQKGYVYDKNLMVKSSESKIPITENSDIYFKDYMYKNGLLAEVKNYTVKYPYGHKTVYQYNDKKQLVNITDYRSKFKDGKLLENEFEKGSETNFIYEGKSVIIKGNRTISQSGKYELY